MFAETMEQKETSFCTKGSEANHERTNQAIPVMTFYQIHETTVCLMNLLEHYSEQSQSYRLSVSPLILDEASVLQELLTSVSKALRDEWMYKSASLKCYVLAGWEEDRHQVWNELLKIRIALGLDECFGERPVREHKNPIRRMDRQEVLR